MIVLAFPGLKEYCQITYNVYRDAWKGLNFWTQTGLQPPFDESGTFLAVVEQRAREKVFPEHLDQIRAKGFEVELFDL